MHENIKEVISPSGKYKATILEKLGCYILDIFVLKENFEPESGIVYGEYWSRQNITPILIDEGFSAEYFAIQELRVLIGEPDTPLSIEWIRDFSFCNNAKFLNPNKINVFYECFDPESKKKNLALIEAKTIIGFEELCLVEESGCEGEWQIGQIDDKGRIICWGSYDTLKEAIAGL